MDQLHQALLRASRDPMMIVDINGRVLASNEAMCRRLGIVNEDLVGSDALIFSPRRSVSLHKTRFSQAVSTGRPMSYTGLSDSGGTFEVVLEPVAGDDGKTETVAIAILNFNPSLALEEERLRLVNAIEQAAEAFIIFDETLAIHYVNQAFEVMTGYAQHEIKGKSIELLYLGEDQKRVLENVILCLEHGDTWSGRSNNTRKDGGIFTCEQTLSRIRGKRFRPLGYVGILRDITETLSLERQLSQAQKMEAVGTLASGIAHDFNNILGPIMLYAELGLKSLPGDDPLSLSLEEILAAAERAQQLVKQILGLSRKRGHDEPVPFQLSSIVKECLKLLRPTIPASIGITFVNNCGSDLILADPGQAHQIIMNICTNAAQAMADERGEMRIAMRNLSTGKELAEIYPEARPLDYVEIVVADTGPGIASEDMARIFDPFFSTKSDKGTGLGLTVVQNIVGNLGGYVKAESTRGEGTSIFVILPVHSQSARLRGRARFETPSGMGHALLVDDDTVMIQGSRSVLEQLGYDVTACRNAYEALAYFRQMPEAFDMVVTEADMPEMSGRELARELHFSRPDLPVVLCSQGGSTAFSAEGDVQVSPCLKKPLRIGELEDILKNLSRGRAARTR